MVCEFEFIFAVFVTFHLFILNLVDQTGHDGPITRAIWHPTSTSLFTTISRDGSLKLWDIRKKGGCFETSRGMWDGSALLDISWTDEDPMDCCGGGETFAIGKLVLISLLR